MKKAKFIIVSILVTLIMPSCEDVLNRLPDYKVWETEVFEQENLSIKYLNNLYSRLVLNSMIGRDDWRSPTMMGRNTDEMSNSLGNPVTNITSGMDRWDYAFIRDINVFINGIRNSKFSEETKAQLEGEARFIRAYEYFEMQKRFGGVPLVDIVIDPYQEIDHKYTKRSTEEEIVNFLDTELTEISNMLSTNHLPRGRANKWTALALKARAMLYAASIADYGIVQLDGIVGVPSSRAADLYTKAANAADEVILSTKYSLYKTTSDPVENYRLIFEDESNSEVIFEEVFDGVKKGHSYDAYVGPPCVGARGSATNNPTLNFVLQYENIDGTTDPPDFGESFLYLNGADLFKNKDPRLLATVFLQGDKWRSHIIQTYEGIDPSPVPDPANIISQWDVEYNGISTVGFDSRNYILDSWSTSTGFITKKYFDNRDEKIIELNSKTNWIDIRLAEMYLTKAEAYYELGDFLKAAEALNETRDRAGISLVDENTITLDKVRRERRAELAFEAQRYWDLRRWRIAESVLNFQVTGLKIIYHLASNKYYFLPFNAEPSSRTFLPQHYYQAIGQSRIQNNPDLVENPLYE